MSRLRGNEGTNEISMKLLTAIIEDNFIQQHTWIKFKKNSLRFI